MDQQALAEYRYRAVREVPGGSPIGEVAERYGTTRQSLRAWRLQDVDSQLLRMRRAPPAADESFTLIPPSRA